MNGTTEHFLDRKRCEPAAGGAAAPADAGGIRRTAPPVGAGQGAQAADRVGQHPLDDLLGTARRGQDHAGAHHRPPHAGGVHRLFRRHQRHPRDPRGHAAGGGKPPLRRADDRVRGRDPSLQQGAAGRLSAVCRKGQHTAHRRHDRESVLRNQRRAAVAVQGVRAAGARRRRSRRAGAARACRPARLRRAKGGDSAGTAGGHRPFRQRRRPAALSTLEMVVLNAELDGDTCA